MPVTQPAQPLSRAQVSAILDQNSYHPPNKFDFLPIEMRFSSFAETVEGKSTRMLNAQEIKVRLEQWCRDAFAFLNPEGEHDLGSHHEQLDTLLSTLVTCNFHAHRGEISKDEVVDRACALLARLPSHPPELSVTYRGGKTYQGKKSLWPAEYLCTYSTAATRPGELCDATEYRWTNLRVLSRPNTNVVRLALYLVMERTVPVGFTSEYSDTLVHLLDTVAELLLSSSISETDAQAWFILQAFLWAAWQQTVMIQLWKDARDQMIIGYSFELHNFLVSKEIPSVMPRRETVEKSRPNYMCKWAFELLRSDLSFATQDFRRLFEIYEGQFGDCMPRCNLAAVGQGRTRSTRQKRICDGKAPGNCQRFESKGIQIQSAHDFECPGDSSCSFLTWDEQSYRNISGARAVSVAETDEKRIRYCPVSGKTMAVSHVWSHGQGGRPETGFNVCLHRRYTALARSLGCTSYWMDTPCIPTDDKLRDEAIGQINDNFENSKVTLLVDRDLMEIDINPITLQAEETILVTLAVSDWNVRAWTLLEGMRGRLKLHILCKANHIISLVDVLKDVLLKSSLALVSPCLAVQHYTPTQYNADKVMPVTIEQATCFLNHRHATKDRDVTMIWGLVCGSNQVIKSAEDFWKSNVGKSLATGFLVSSSPRVKNCRGLSWAPSRPNLLPPNATATATAARTPNEKANTNANVKQYPAFDGQNSVGGYIAAEGFRAEWLACPIRRSRALPTWFWLYTFATGGYELEDYYTVYNKNGNSRINVRSFLKLRSVIAPLFKRYRWVILLLPAVRDRSSTGATAPPRPFAYQGEINGVLLVVAASQDQKEWEWQFVHEWDTQSQLPEFVLTEVLIV